MRGGVGGAKAMGERMDGHWPFARGVAIAPGGGRAFGSPGGAPGTSRGAVGSRATPCPCGTESASKAAPELGPVTACRAVGAAPHLDPKFAITVRPSASTTPSNCPSLSSS